MEFEALKPGRVSVDQTASIFLKTVGFSDTMCYRTINYTASCLKRQLLQFFPMVEYYIILHLFQGMRPNILFHKLGIKLKVKIKVMFTLEQATNAHRGSRSIDLIFL